VTEVSTGDSEDAKPESQTPIVPPPIPTKSVKSGGDEPRQSRPWRDNIEAVTMAIIMAIFLKYFVIEAYKIPTGSMQPTLMGNEDTAIYDRILVDKLSYHFRDPVRWEVSVFKYPLDLSKNFIKRICGMPGEDLKIQDGDLWTRKNKDEQWQALRRPDNVQWECWKALDTDSAWKIDAKSKSWSQEDDRVVAGGEGSARFPKVGHSIMDTYLDGYPAGMIEKIRRKKPATNEVGDLRWQAEVTASADCRVIAIELQELTRRYRLTIPGPQAAPGSKPMVHVTDAANRLPDTITEAKEAFQLSAGDSIDIAFQNLDNLLRFELDGDTLIEVEVPAAPDQRSTITIATEGGGAEFDDIEVYRDIYYTAGGAMSQWSIPDDSYVMLGDNTQDSADSREWRLTGYRFVDGDDSGKQIWGNLRGSENPRVVTGQEGGPQIFFTDQFGERHHFAQSEAVRETYENAPFVKRELMTGRALLVFWPMSPSLGVYRLQWIH
jgi:signal peptidase I